MWPKARFIESFCGCIGRSARARVYPPRFWRSQNSGWPFGLLWRCLWTCTANSSVHFQKCCVLCFGFAYGHLDPSLLAPISEPVANLVRFLMQQPEWSEGLSLNALHFFFFPFSLRLLSENIAGPIITEHILELVCVLPGPSTCPSSLPLVDRWNIFLTTFASYESVLAHRAMREKKNNYYEVTRCHCIQEIGGSSYKSSAELASTSPSVPCVWCSSPRFSLKSGVHVVSCSLLALLHHQFCPQQYRKGQRSSAGASRVSSGYPRVCVRGLCVR